VFDDAMGTRERNGTTPEDGHQPAWEPSLDVTPTAAVRLGWRIAELYAGVDDTGAPADDTLLPGHASLDATDQLELQVRAAMGDARRAGVASKSGVLERVVPYARRAPNSHEAVEDFRAQLRKCHVELTKDLWARDEALGKAYELGNGISDTYGRIRRAYDGPAAEQRSAWNNVFKPARIERLKRLLDDLQSQLNPAGVAVVRNHLDIWCEGVRDRISSDRKPPEPNKVREGLRRQTVIWQQLIAGDKEPEAYLNSEARAEVQSELRRFVWKRYSAWIAPAAGILFLLIVFLPRILSWYGEGALGTSAASALVAIGGALGITKASALVTVRSRLHKWSELLWNRALAKKVRDKTLVLDSVLDSPAAERPSLADVAAASGSRIKEAVMPHPRPIGSAHTSF
jgi:hypothetical protein